MENLTKHHPGEDCESRRNEIVLRIQQAGQKLAQFVRGAGVAVFDQGIVSGTNLVSTLLIGRCCGAKSLGWYAIGFTFIVLAESVHSSLITTPYTVYANRWRDRRLARYAGSVLTHHVFVSLLVFLSLGTASLLLGQAGDYSMMVSLLACLSLVIPCVLLRSLVRRIAFAHLYASVALIVDLTVMVVQVGTLAGLAVSGNLTVATAFASMAFACAISGGLWLGLALPKKIFSKRNVLAAWKRNWKLGRWILATETTASLRSCVIPWQLALMVGEAATGLFAACMVVISLSNPLITGMGNIMSPRIARALGQGSLSAMRREVHRLTWILALFVTVFCGIIGFAGNQILGLIYGSEFSAQGATLLLLAIAVLFSAIGHPPGFGLLAMERSRTHFFLRLIGLAVTIVATFALLPAHHVQGAAEGLLLGSLVVTILTHCVFHRITSSKHLLENDSSEPTQLARNYS